MFLLGKGTAHALELSPVLLLAVVPCSSLLHAPHWPRQLGLRRLPFTHAGPSRSTTARPASWACTRCAASPPCSTTCCRATRPRCARRWHPHRSRKRLASSLRRTPCISSVHDAHEERCCLPLRAACGRPPGIHVPTLMVAMPKQAPRLWLRRLLLIPPSPTVATALRSACAFLAGAPQAPHPAHKQALPDLSCQLTRFASTSCGPAVSAERLKAPQTCKSSIKHHIIPI